MDLFEDIQAYIQVKLGQPALAGALAFLKGLKHLYGDAVGENDVQVEVSHFIPW
jgi:hypothetical protein